MNSYTEIFEMSLYDHLMLNKSMPPAGMRGAMFMQNSVDMDEGASITNMPTPGYLPTGCSFLVKRLRLSFMSDNARLSVQEERDALRVIASGGWFELHIMSKVYARDTLRILNNGYPINPYVNIDNRVSFGLALRWKEYPRLDELDLDSMRDKLRIDLHGTYERPVC